MTEPMQRRVAHCLRTLQDADRILVFGDGGIVEEDGEGLYDRSHAQGLLATVR